MASGRCKAIGGVGKSGSQCRRDYWRSSHGGLAVTFAMALPVLMGAAGIASDFAVFNLKQAQLQAAADAAAIAGAKELALSDATVATVTAMATEFVNGSLQLASSDLITHVSIEDDISAVRVKVTEMWTPFFAHFIGADITPVFAEAKASLTGQTNICVLALAGSGTKAVYLDKTSNLIAKSCGVYSDSTDALSILLEDSSTIKAALTCSAGGVTIASGSIDAAPTTDCPVVEDPLASRTPPSFGVCDFTDVKFDSGAHVVNPGVYCGGLHITGSAVVTFSEGNYIITGGKFSVSGLSTAIGEHVAFYLDGPNATINFTQNTTVSFTGAKDGPMAGLLFFEDRSAKLNRPHRINSVNAHRLTGTIYLSRGDLLIDPSTSVAQDSAYTAIVVNKLEINNGPNLVLNSNYGATDVPVPAGIRASAQVVLSE